MPKVSIIIPVYRVEQYIERCARTLFEQTLDNIEYLFIDDCTPDRSIDILKQVLEDYPNRKRQVIIHRMNQNSGQAKVREWGMKNASGDYVIHCDSDDWVDRDMFRMMYDKAIEEEADVVVCDFVTHDGMEKIRLYQGCRQTGKEGFLRDLMFQKCDWAVWNKLVKRELYDELCMWPVGAMGEDMVMTLQTVYFSKKIAYVDVPLYFYYLNRNSISHRRSSEAIIKKVEQLVGNYRLIEQFFMNKSVASEYEHALNYIQYSIKSKLLSRDKLLTSTRRKLFKYVEYKVFFYPELNWNIRKKIVKMIINDFCQSK